VGGEVKSGRGREENSPVLFFPFFLDGEKGVQRKIEKEKGRHLSSLLFPSFLLLGRGEETEGGGGEKGKKKRGDKREIMPHSTTFLFPAACEGECGKGKEGRPRSAGFVPRSLPGRKGKLEEGKRGGPAYPQFLHSHRNEKGGKVGGRKKKGKKEEGCS